MRSPSVPSRRIRLASPGFRTPAILLSALLLRGAGSLYAEEEGTDTAPPPAEVPEAAKSPGPGKAAPKVRPPANGKAMKKDTAAGKGDGGIEPRKAVPRGTKAAPGAGAKNGGVGDAASAKQGTQNGARNGAKSATKNGAKNGAKAGDKAGPARKGAEPGRPAAAGGEETPGGIGAPGAEPPVGAAAEGEPVRSELFPRKDDFLVERVDIAPGDIEILDFLRFLNDYTGLPIIVDSRNQQALKNTITIAARMDDVTPELVIAILKANGFLVTRLVLTNGDHILNVEPTQAAVPQQDEPTEQPLISVDQGVASRIDTPLTAELQNLRADEIATMVFTLKYTQPADAITSLNSLISGQKAVKSKAFSIVDVKNSMLVIITAKFGLLNYLQKLLTIIDVPIKEQERIIQIIDVENADAEEMTALIQQFLQGRTGTGARLGTRAQPAVAQPGQPGQPIQAGGRAGDLQTNLIADWRTQKIIIETYNERDLEDIFMLVRELDIRYDIRRLKTRIYQVRYLKADEVAADLQSLLGGSSFGLSGRAGLGTRGAAGAQGGGRSTRSRGGLPRVGRQGGLPTSTPGVPGGQQAGGQNAPMPALIVPHIQTNSLIIQAEPEEYAEVLNILEQIDVKRRQVFLEAALVEVTTQSNLNYSIELLAGEPNDQSTRVLFESSFGLSGLDFENFNRAIPDLSNPASVPPGALVAIMNRGKFPALIRFFKGNTDSQVLATPFILADDNQTNIIDIIETRFVQNTATVNTATTTSQEGEDAGISLEITPTISSKSAVFLELGLEVSQFQGAGTPQVLPPKTTNTITSAVTIPDGEIFVIGGLTRENKSKSVSKVPILGDIPLLGKLFRSEDSFKSASNLYIFLRAHVLTHPEFLDGVDITVQTMGLVHQFAPGLKPMRIEKPDVPPPLTPPSDPDAPRRFYRESRSKGFQEGYEAPQGPYEVQGAPTSTARGGPELSRGGPESYRGDPESPFRDAGREGAPPVPRSAANGTPPGRGEGGLEKPDALPETPPGNGKGGRPSPAPASEAEERRRALEGTGVEIDPEGKSWLIPLRPRGNG